MELTPSVTTPGAPQAAPAQPREERGRPASAARLSPPWLAWVALAALLAVGGAFLYHETRDTTFWRDEFIWAQTRRGNSAGTFLDDHFGHLSLVPVVIYRLLFATAGLRHHAPYALVSVAAHLTVVGLLFAYARRRVGDVLALLVAALMLFLGPAAQNILWPFQMAWLISLAAGIGALLALDRRDRAGDVAACALVALSLASSGVGIAVAAGATVDVLWGRRRWRDAWIVAIPLALYGLWTLTFQSQASHDLVGGVLSLPGLVADAPAAALSSLAGLAGSTTIDGPLSPLTWGAPLAIVAVAFALWRIRRLGSVPPRFAALMTAWLVFWTATALGRSIFVGPKAGRYIYVGALLLLLAGVELARGVRVSKPVAAACALAVCAAVASNVFAFRDAAADLRRESQMTRAELGVLDIARPLAPPGYVSQGFLFDEVIAGPYFRAEDALGTPAATPAQLARLPEDARAAADAQLRALHAVALRAAPATLRPGPAPVVDAVAGGSIARRGACVSVRAGGASPALLAVTLPPGGALLRAGAGGATVAVRRFAARFPRQSLGTLASGGTALLRIGPDRAAQPWYVGLSARAGGRVCGVG